MLNIRLWYKNGTHKDVLWFDSFRLSMGDSIRTAFAADIVACEVLSYTP